MLRQLFATSLCLFVASILAACGSSSAEENEQSAPPRISDLSYENATVTLAIEPTGDLGSWYTLGDYSNGIPGYSGGFATYTAHHTPMAVKYRGNTYYTYSDNSSGRLDIYVKRNQEASVGITRLRFSDPHRNASLSIDDEGYIYVYISARGSSEPSLTFKSIVPEQLVFQLIQQRTFAYPQPWNIKGQQVMLYSNYEVDQATSNTYRTIHIDNSSCSGKLVDGGHYQVSYYDGERLFSFYNWTPEGRPTTRHNLYYIESYDGGCSWFNAQSVPLTLPLTEDSDEAILHRTLPSNLYPLDAYVLNGEPAVMFIESPTASPRRGPYDLFVWRNGQREFVTQVGHQYNTGFMYQRGSREFIVTPTLGIQNFAGGNIGLFERIDDSWVLIDEVSDGGNYNYIRRIYGSDGEAILTEAASDKKSPAYLYRLRLDFKTYE